MKVRSQCLGMMAVLAFLASTASASVIAVRPGALSELPPITFDGLPLYMDVFGGVVRVRDATFDHDLPAHAYIWEDRFGIANNVNGPVNLGWGPGTLTVRFDSPYTIFGYGFALNSNSPIDNATAITLFSGQTNVGALSYAAFPDPAYAGGFAGIQSTDPFDSVQIAFNPGYDWALDNVVFGAPEPSTVLLALAGGLGLTGRYRLYGRE